MSIRRIFNTMFNRAPATIVITDDVPERNALLVYDVGPGGGGGGGGGAVTIVDGGDETQGAIDDAAVDTDDDGTVNAHLRGLVKSIGNTLDNGVDTDDPGTVIAHLRGIGNSIGPSTDIAVDGDFDATVNSHLRGLGKTIGLITDVASTTTDATPQTEMSVLKGILAALGFNNGAKVITDANGTIQQYLRGIVTLLSGTAQVEGTIASGATDGGNPVKAGGKYNSSAPTLTNGQRGDLQVDVNANLMTVDPNFGAKADTVWDGSAGSPTGMAIFKYIGAKIEAVRALLAGTLTATSVGTIVQVAQTFNRPGDTTAYAANDVVADSTSAATLMSFANVVRANGGQGVITSIRLLTNLKSISPRFRIHFFHTSGGTFSNDNAQYQAKFADKDKRIGSYDMAAMSTAADTTNSDYSGTTDINTPRIEFVCGGSSRTIYALLETLDAFTPANGQTFWLEIRVDEVS